MNFERAKLGATFILGMVLSMLFYACEHSPIMPTCPPGIEVPLESGTYRTTDEPFTSRDYDGPAPLANEALVIEVDRGGKVVKIESKASDFALELEEQESP